MFSHFYYLLSYSNQLANLQLETNKKPLQFLRFLEQKSNCEQRCVNTLKSRRKVWKSGGGAQGWRNRGCPPDFAEQLTLSQPWGYAPHPYYYLPSIFSDNPPPGSSLIWWAYSAKIWGGGNAPCPPTFRRPCNTVNEVLRLKASPSMATYGFTQRLGSKEASFVSL